MNVNDGLTLEDFWSRWIQEGAMLMSLWQSNNASVQHNLHHDLLIIIQKVIFQPKKELRPFRRQLVGTSVAKERLKKTLT